MVDAVLAAIFWLAALSLVHVYAGYEVLLRILVPLRPVGRDTVRVEGGGRPTVSVLLTVHNEQHNIVGRLDDLLAQDYPSGAVEIVVASDASDDDTERLTMSYAADHPERAIRLIACPLRGGKSAAQNQALPKLSGEVVVLTDAATRFASDFLSRVVEPFADPTVGCVGGQVVFAEAAGAVSRGQQRYWRFEMVLRARESHLGILAVASGQAMAFRRVLFRPLPLHIGDDCIIPLDIAAAGARVVHQPTAIAHDMNETRTGRELWARARMTARNWVGTWRHPGLLSPFSHPGYALALWSHKLMRWLSPIFLLLLGGSSLLLARQPFYGLCAASGAGICLLALLGYWAEGGSDQAVRSWRPRRFALAQFCFSFIVAQIGFLWGLWIVVTGKRIQSYSNKV